MYYYNIYYNACAHIMRVHTHTHTFMMFCNRETTAERIKSTYLTCARTPPRETQNVFYWFIIIIIIIIFLYCISFDISPFGERRPAGNIRRGLAFRSDIMETRASYFHSIWHRTLLVIVP